MQEIFRQFDLLFKFGHILYDEKQVWEIQTVNYAL